MAASAIVAVATDRDVAGTLMKLRTAIVKTGNIDSAVCAFRGSPELLRVAADDEAFSPVLRRIIRRVPDPSFAAAVGIRLPAPHRGKAQLSRREEEVLELVSSGLTNREVARRLFLSEKTIKTHLQNIYGKLEVNSRTEAAMWAARRP